MKDTYIVMIIAIIFVIIGGFILGGVHSLGVTLCFLGAFMILFGPLVTLIAEDE